MVDFTRPVSDIMTKELITVQPDELMTVVDRIFKTHKIHHIPVIEADGTVIGMISKSDYLRTLHSLSLFKTAKVEAYNEAVLKSLLVREVMAKQLARLRPESPISLAADMLLENLFHALPVVEDGRLVGIVTSFDLLKYAYKQY